MRRAARADANQTEIIKFLRELGASVQPLHTVGGGCPDLLVGRGGRNFLLEVKDGTKSASRQILTPDQGAWRAAWSGQYAVVTSKEDCLSVLGMSIDPDGFRLTG